MCACIDILSCVQALHSLMKYFEVEDPVARPAEGTEPTPRSKRSKGAKASPASKTDQTTAGRKVRIKVMLFDPKESFGTIKSVSTYVSDSLAHGSHFLAPNRL